MSIETLLQRLSTTLNPSNAAQERVKQRLLEKTIKAPVFNALNESLTPKRVMQNRIKNRLMDHIREPVAETLEDARTQIAPAASLQKQLKIQILDRLQPIGEQISYRFRTIKMVAAFAVLMLIVRASPFVFLATPTVAESRVSLMPTRGDVSVSIGGFWQPVSGELTLEPGMLLKTHDGEASILFRDDGVIRLDAETTVRINDTSDNLEVTDSDTSTITLFAGRIWVQGLIPSSLRGMNIETSYGTIDVHEGSVSIAEDDVVDVEVYDRRASVQRSDEEVILAASERTTLSDNNVILVKKIPEKWYQRNWAKQNLERDAVHRSDIARKQHADRVKSAGILPTSHWYPFKRLAEEVDVLFTFNGDARVQKRLSFAQTRLNEAAALIAQGEEQNVDATLDEFRGALMNIASGSGEGSLAQFLVQRALSETAAGVAAALPGDEAYPLKKTVLEASADLPDDIVAQEEVRGTLLLDELAVLSRKVDEGDTNGIQQVWHEIQPYLTALEDESIPLKPEVHKEAQAILTFFAVALHDASSSNDEIDPELLDDIAAFLPPVETSIVALTEEEVQNIAQTIRDKIFVYNMQNSRINQFVAEIRALNSHPDKGRILRRLALILPNGPENFPDRVYKEIVQLRWAQAAQTL